LYLPVADDGLAVSAPDPSPSFDRVSWYCTGGGGATVVKVAVTLCGPFITTAQGLLVPQLFDQPPNCEPELGVAVSDTDVPWLYVPPGGLSPTDPVPFPAIDTPNVYCFKVKVAVTVLAASIVTLQLLPFAVQPDQLVNTELAAGEAESVTVVPWLNVPPGGVTVPDPFPAFDTVKVYCFKVKVTVTVFGPSIVTVQVAPLCCAQPDQLVNSELAAGEAETVTTVPWLYVPPVGLSENEPDPFPAFNTVNAYCFNAKFAVTVLAASIVTVQVLLPLAVQPDQPVKFDAEFGVAVSVTTVPAG
jgi:hypothetical protein